MELSQRHSILSILFTMMRAVAHDSDSGCNSGGDVDLILYVQSLKMRINIATHTDYITWRQIIECQSLDIGTTSIAAAHASLRKHLV